MRTVARSTEARFARLEAALLAKVAPKQAPEFVPDDFPMQAAYLLAGALLLVVLCTRRAGKSFAAALRLLRAAWSEPGCSCLYIALTRDSAKKILWKDCLKAINRKMGLGIKFNETELSATLPNGSVIYLLGVDAEEDEKQKLLGQKYKEVVIDESASFTIDLNELVYGILKPATADYRGAISLIGTPGVMKSGLFFDLTHGQDPSHPGTWQKQGWTGFRWSWADNPHVCKQIHQEIVELKAANPLVEETPLFQQHYLGLWVVEESKFVYRYRLGRNDFVGGLPKVEGKGGRWHYVLGVDLGWRATAFSVMAYHDFHRPLYLLKSWKRAGLDITATASAVKQVYKDYDVDASVVDGANRQAVEEMNQRHGLQLLPAEKPEKFAYIDLMNDDFVQANILVDRAGCADLCEEYSNLVLDPRPLAKGKREEHPNAPNHCCDASLYGWRYAYAYLATPQKPAPAQGTAEYWKAQEDEMEKAATEETLRALQESDTPVSYNPMVW